MKKKLSSLLALLLAALVVLPWGALAGGDMICWRVNISHDLNGGSWPDGQEISPHTITARNGKSMPADGLDAEKMVRPYMAESVFLGWSVLFTDPRDGRVMYDSGDEVWDLNDPFDYYPDNPSVMNCLMTANWGSSQTGRGSSLPQEILPDGRVLTRPFIVGTQPLPETPPPSDQIIPGTAWLTNALICAIDEGMKVPVYAFPAWNGPIIDWIGLDADVEYGLFLTEGWVMLYHPKWVEAAGIGFIDAGVVDFPGCEE